MDFNIASTGLKNTQRNIDVISNNIANENTAGYRKQSVQNVEGGSIIKGGLAQGTGVRTDDISQKIDNIIYQNMLSKVGVKNYFNSSVTYSTEVENIFQDNQTIGLNQSIKDIFSSLNDLKNNTENKAIEAVTLDKMDKVSTDFNSMISNLKNSQDIVISDVKKDINVLNSSLQELQSVAKSLKSHYSPDLADKKATLEQKISSMIDTKVYYDDNGDYNVMIAGHKILDSSSFRKLELKNNKIVISDNNIDITDRLNEGSIGAKSQIALSTNNMIDNQILKLNVLAAGVISEFNQTFQQNAFETASSKSFNNNDLLNLNILDNPELKGINPGNMTFILHNYQDGVTEKYTANISHDTSLLDLKNQIETASGNKIDFTIAAGKVSISASGQPIQIKEDDNLNFSKVFGFNKLFTGTNASDISLNSQYKNKPDTFFVENDKLVSNANYETVSNLTDLQFKKVDFKEILKYQDYFNKEYYLNSSTNTVGIEKSSFNDFFENITFSVSKKVSNFKQASNLQDKVFEAVNKQYENNVTVSKDEELVKMMQYQAAYSANAKVITAMKDMFDTILQMV